MLKRLQSRVFRIDANASFQAAFMDYYNKREEFSPEAMGLADWSEMAKKSVSFFLKLLTVMMISIKLTPLANRVRR
jgi:hypothetical protein